MKRFRVGLAQTSPILGDLDANLKVCRATVESARVQGVDLLVFPELALTGYFLKDMVPVVSLSVGHPLLEELCGLARGISLLVGCVEEGEDHIFYNAALYLEEGAVRERHRKVYLPTYGMFDEQRYFGSGDRIRAFDSRLGRAGVLICEEAWHASTPYILSQDGASVILCCAAAPARGMGPEPALETTRYWEDLNRLYARLFSAWVIFVNRVGCEDGVTFWGGSEIVDPEGERVVKAPYFEEGLWTGTVDEEGVRRARMYAPILRDERLDVTLRELERIRDERARHQP